MLDAVSVLIAMLVLVLVLAHILTRSLRRIRIISFGLRLLIHGSCSFDGASFRDLCIAGYSVIQLVAFGGVVPWRWGHNWLKLSNFNLSCNLN